MAAIGVDGGLGGGIGEGGGELEEEVEGEEDGDVAEFDVFISGEAAAVALAEVGV